MESVTPQIRVSNISTDQDGWAKTFPTNLEEESHSKEFVYRFIVLSTAMILEKRRLLPEVCFRKRIVEKLHLSSFNMENDVAKRLRSKIEALKGGIESGYVAEFALVFYRKPDEEDVFEVFSFKFQYKNGGQSVALSLSTGIEEKNSHLVDFEFQDLQSVRNEFIKTMKILHRYISRGLEDLPENSDGSFRVAYTSKAPADYVLPGYEKSQNFYKLDTSNETARFGMVGGAHHAVRVLGASLLQKKNTVDFNKTYASIEDSILVKKRPETSKATSATKNAQKSSSKKEKRRSFSRQLKRSIPRISQNA